MFQHTRTLHIIYFWGGYLLIIHTNILKKNKDIYACSLHARRIIYILNIIKGGFFDKKKN